MSDDKVRRMTPGVDISVMRGLESVQFTGRTLEAVFVAAGRWLGERDRTDRHRVVLDVSLTYDEGDEHEVHSLCLCTVPPQREGQRPYSPADPE